MLSSEWRKPFNVSIGLHIIVVAFAMLAPNLFERQARLPEIYTVNLFTATEMEQISPSPAESPAIKEIEPEVKKPAISIQPAKPEISPAAPKAVEPISLNPVKRKIKVGKTKAETAIEKAKLSQAVQRIKAKAEAESATKDAVSKLADSLKTYAPAPTSEKPLTGQTGTTTKAATVSGPKGTGLEPDFYMKQYLSAVYQKIHDHWILPDLQNWDNALEAILSIRIRKDGTVANSYFEKKSDNIYFNQFVLKAVKEASPLPPFPDQLEEDILEVGLRFKPGALY